MAKLRLKEYESLLAMSTVTKDWEVISIHDDHGNLQADFCPWQPTNITVGGSEDEAKIIDEICKIQKVGLLQFIILSIQSVKVRLFDQTTPPFQDGVDTEKALASEMICWRRAL